MLTVLCKGTLLRMRLSVGVRSVLRCERLSQRNTLRTPIVKRILKGIHTLTQHDMLPQHPLTVRELINESYS